MSMTTAPEGYANTLKPYGPPPKLALNATGGAVTKNAWPNSNKLANMVKGTRAKVMGGPQAQRGFKKIISDTVSERSSSQIW